MKKEERKRNIIFFITIILMSIYLGWRILFTLPFEEGVLNVIFGVLLILAETITVFTTFELFFQKMRMDRYRLECPEIPDECYPDVDVFIATHNESADLLYKTVNACTFMSYPDKSKVHIYLCDDGNREEIKKLADAFQIGYDSPAYLSFKNSPLFPSQRLYKGEWFLETPKERGHGG
jgi:cellulose synthase (UDP-forming)